jgi:hypothetical protein
VKLGEMTSKRTILALLWLEETKSREIFPFKILQLTCTIKKGKNFTPKTSFFFLLPENRAIGGKEIKNGKDFETGKFTSEICTITIRR